MWTKLILTIQCTHHGRDCGISGAYMYNYSIYNVHVHVICITAIV